VNDEAFSSSISNFLHFIDPPSITGSSPAVAPLGHKGVEIYIEGGTFDPSFEYFCLFKTRLAH